MYRSENTASGPELSKNGSCDVKLLDSKVTAFLAFGVVITHFYKKKNDVLLPSIMLLITKLL